MVSTRPQCIERLDMVRTLVTNIGAASYHDEVMRVDGRQGLDRTGSRKFESTRTEEHRRVLEKVKPITV